MSKSLAWRGLIVLFFVLAALIYLMPSLTSDLPMWWSNVLPRDKIRLGLDLQGGMHLVLEVETLKAVENHLERVVEELKQDLRKKKIRYQDMKRLGTKGITVALMRSEDQDAFEDMANSNYLDFEVDPISAGEDRAEFNLLLRPKAKTRVMKMAADQALETIRNRIDQFGVSEPDIRP
ncbi:MAG: protein translocase subunit SecD, partial [Thermodesulfobacteriota bacterium]|nr:protein translocase subunit SecD [Thermodesulfobacteriota bacterium]